MATGYLSNAPRVGQEEDRPDGLGGAIGRPRAASLAHALAPQRSQQQQRVTATLNAEANPIQTKGFPNAGACVYTRCERSARKAAGSRQTEAHARRQWETITQYSIHAQTSAAVVAKSAGLVGKPGQLEQSVTQDPAPTGHQTAAMSHARAPPGAREQSDARRRHYRQGERTVSPGLSATYSYCGEPPGQIGDVGAS